MNNILTKWLSALLIAALFMTPVAMMEEAPAGEPVAAETETQTEDVPEVVPEDVPEEAPEETDDVPEAAVIPEAVDAVVTEACDIDLDVVAEDEAPVEVSDEAEEGNALIPEAQIVEESLDDLAEFEAAEEGLDLECLEQVTGDVVVDKNNFPDDVFRQYVLDNFDNNTKDGKLSQAEREAVFFMDFTKKDGNGNILFNEPCPYNIKDMTGIGLFTNLNNLCYDNGTLESLDLSGLTKLRELRCRNNKLRTLLLTGCTALENIECQGNQLQQIDISTCTTLLPAVKEPYKQSDGCYSMQQGNGWLGINYDGSTTKLILANGDVVEPSGQNDPSGQNAPSGQNTTPGPNDIPIDAAHFPDPGFRDHISNADKDNNGYLSEGERNAVNVISPSGRTLRPGVNYYNLFFDIGLCDIRITNSVQSLQGIEYFPNIEELSCEGNNLTGTLDLSHNTNLRVIYLSKNNLTSLILGNQPKLTFLDCTHNQLTSLDISGCPELVCVDCWDNSIGNFYTNRVLTGFRCRYFNFVNYVRKWTKNKKKAKYCEYGTDKGRLMCDKSLRIIGDKFTPDPSVEQISVAGKRAKVAVNAGTTFQINPGAKAGKKFKSSKKKVATVDSNGIVTAKAKGKTKITFKVGKKKRTLTLTVNDPTIPQSVTLSAPTTAVKKGDTVTLTPAVPEGTNPGGFKWKSSNKKVATVNNGVVTFKKAGKVTITCTTVRGKKKARVTFAVSK